MCNFLRNKEELAISYAKRAIEEVQQGKKGRVNA